MLLKNIERKNILKKLKEKFFHYQYCIVSTQEQLNHFFHFLLLLFSLIPKVSFILKSSPFEPEIINKFFRCFLFSGIAQSLQISDILIYSLAIGLMFMFIGNVIFTYNNQIINSFSYKLLVFQVNFFIYFKIAVTQIHLNMITNQSQDSLSTFFTIISIFTYLFYITFSVLYIKFNIKPLRKKNNQWRFNNNQQIQYFFLNVSRTIVFMFDGITLKVIILSLAFEFLWRVAPKCYQTQFYRINANTASNCVISTHIGVIISLAIEDKVFATKIWTSLLLIAVFKGFYDYFNQSSRPIQLPLCGSSSFQYYDFYFLILEKYETKSSQANNSQHQNFYFTIFKQHIKKCKRKKCQIKDICIMPKNILPQLEQIISDTIAQQKMTDPQSEILDELWKLERGKKFILRNIIDTYLKVQFQYIIFCIQKNDLTQGALLSNNATSTLLINTQFLENINKILFHFYQFYEQILRPQPKLQTLTSLGLSIREKVQNSQDLYKQLLKNKCITFQLIQFFIEFQNTFLKRTSLTPAAAKKISEIQKNIQTDEVEKNQFPTLTVYPDNGLIENVNMQCLSLMKQSRYQIKTKNIKQIFAPNFKVEFYEGLPQEQKQIYLMFIKKRNDQFICGRLKIMKKFKNNKKINIYIFKRQKKLQGQNFVLVNAKFQAIHFVAVQEYLKDKKPQKKFLMNWTNIYEKYIKNKKNQLKNSKVIRVDMREHQSCLTCSLSNTLNQDYFVISMKVIKNIKQIAHKQRRSIMMNKINEGTQICNNHKKFVFYHDLNSAQRVSLVGMKKQKQQRNFNGAKMSMSFQIFVGKLKTTLIHQTLLKNRNFEKGIKTYRLYDNELYNIDLEDKQAYVQEFNDKMKKQNQGKAITNFSDSYIIAFVICIAVIMTGITVLMYFNLQSQMDDLKQNFAKFNEIDQFTLNFYRILAMLRDVASGLYQQFNRDWIKDVTFSYNQLFQDQNQKLFSNQKLKISFNNHIYVGNLNQLIQVIMSNVYLLTVQYDKDIIENIHNTAILELTPLVQIQQDQVKIKLQNGLDGLNSNTFNFLIGIMFGTILFYVLMLFLCAKLFTDIKNNLNSIMMISDTQARKSQQNTQKLIYAIQMMKKNYQIDLKSLLLQQKNHRPRKKQKQVIVGLRMKVIIGLVIFFFLTTHITLIFIFKNMIKTKTQQFSTIKLQGEDIIGVYASLCKETNRVQHTGQLILNNVKLLRAQIKNVEKARGSFSFHPDTNQAIINYFFENSCERITNLKYIENSHGLTCKKSTPGYQIQNPFEIGLAMYLSRVHYNIIDNLPQTYASTGVYSFLFARVFRELSIMITLDGQQKLSEFISLAKSWMIIFIIIDVLYCLVASVLSFYVKKKIVQVDKLVKFLDVKDSYSKQQKKSN